MILVTGGAGFIGSHTVRALHGLGEQSLLVQRRTSQAPAHLADLPVEVEQGDVTDLALLLEAGSRHHVTGIVHLAGYDPWLPGPGPVVPATRKALDGLLNVVEAAQQWGIGRIGVASTIGVFSGTWGPLGHQDPFFAAPALIHAAARGTAPDLSGLLVSAHAQDALDLCYVKDTGRAIALLQLADHLSDRTYNVASGRSTSNAEIIRAIKTVAPDADLELPAAEAAPDTYLDISRATRDTGYQPQYDTERATADYISWLRAATRGSAARHLARSSTVQRHDLEVLGVRGAGTHATARRSACAPWLPDACPAAVLLLHDARVSHGSTLRPAADRSP